MKYLLPLILFVASAAHACIHPLSTTVNLVGPTGIAWTNSAPDAAMLSSTSTYSTTNLLTNITITYGLGTCTIVGGLDTGFVVNPQAPTVTLSLFITYSGSTPTVGNWQATASTGGSMAAGQLTGANLTGAITTFSTGGNTLRDDADYALTAASLNIMPGTQVCRVLGCL